MISYLVFSIFGYMCGNSEEVLCNFDTFNQRAGLARLVRPPRYWLKECIELDWILPYKSNTKYLEFKISLSVSKKISVQFYQCSCVQKDDCTIWIDLQTQCLLKPLPWRLGQITLYKFKNRDIDWIRIKDAEMQLHNPSSSNRMSVCLFVPKLLRNAQV